MPSKDSSASTIARTWRDFVDVAVVAKNRRDLADYLRFHNRLPSEEDQLVIGEHLRRLAESAVVIHFDDVRKATGVLRSGRFYSAMEQGKMLPGLERNRRRTEVALFGEKSGNIPDVIYATLGNTGSHGYGDVAIYLNSRVKIRSTVTRKDSMNAMTGADFDPVSALCVASGFDDLNCLAVPLRSKGEIVVANRIEDLSQNSYFEVQIHGGVTTDDIDGMSVARNAITSGLEDWVRERGIIIEERKQ